MSLFGRRKILCDDEVITSENVVRVLQDALLVHNQNSIECEYLYNYRKGDQPILEREKTIRPEICNKIVENGAEEIVSFKVGYLCGEPIQYISRSSEDGLSEDISKLNDMMLMCGKSALDKELAEWMYTCGTSYRMAMSNTPYIESDIVPKIENRKTDFSEDEAPFEIYTLDPRYTFVVYHSGLGEKPLMAVKYIQQNTGVSDKLKSVYSVWTNNKYYEITNDGDGKSNIITNERELNLQSIPVIEYPLNNARQGVIETVIHILDAINTVQSNRVDGIEQFIQSMMVLTNAEIDDQSAVAIREAGLIKLKSIGDIKASVEIISEELDQQQVQTFIDYCHQRILEIVGMPNRNGGSSTSDTGAAVFQRDGHSSTESHAKSDELMVKESERKLLKIILQIMRNTVGTKLTLADIDVHFTRRNYENGQSKAQILTSMLASDKIAPELAFTQCGMFSDPEDATKKSAVHYEKVKAEQAALAEKEKKETPGDAVA